MSFWCGSSKSSLSLLCILLAQRDYQQGAGIFPCVQFRTKFCGEPEAAFEFSKLVRKFCGPYRF